MIELSVIMPVYNAERYLGESLGSVLGQTLREIEVICVNDGSSDGSLRLLRAAAAKDGRIRVIDQPNRGAAAARNAALEMAQGEYVAFMDADDVYPADDILERFCHAAAETHADLCGGRLEHLLPGGDVLNAEDPPYFGFQAYLFRRTLIVGSHLRFPPYCVFEDPPFLVAAMAAAKHMERVGFATYRYRVDYRKPGGCSLADPVRGRDYLRGLTDVVRISAAAELEEVHKAALGQCRSLEMLGLMMEWLRRDPTLMEGICRLQAALPEGELLPAVELSGMLSGRCHAPVGTLAEAMRQMKAALGRRIPEQIKLWRRKTTGK